MALLLLASAWYLALVAVGVFAAVAAHRRRQADQAALDADLSYDERRRRERAEHLARQREEELAELRRRHRFDHRAHA